MQISPLRFVPIVLPFLIAGSALGQTGLVRMPVADVLRHGEGTFELEAVGAEHGDARRYEHAAGLAVGLFDRLELGGEADFMGRYEGHAKYLLFENPKSLPNTALSVGFTGWSGSKIDPYLVGRYDGHGYRCHYGAWRTGGCVCGMVGTDFPIWGSLNGSIEYLGGSESESWAAVNYSPTFLPGFEVELALGKGFGHEGHADGIHTGISVAYGFKF